MKYLIDTNIIVYSLWPYEFATLQNSYYIDTFLKTKLGDRCTLLSIVEELDRLVNTRLSRILGWESEKKQIMKINTAMTIDEILTNYRIINTDQSVIRLANQIYQDYYQKSNLSLVDCHLLAAARENNLAILSFDMSLLKIASILKIPFFAPHS